MADEIKINAETRTEFGKGAARRIRRAEKVPAVLYQHGGAPIHVSLPGHDTMLALKHSNALLTVAVGSDTHLAIPKQVQRDPIKGFIEHVDLLMVRRGEKVVVDVGLAVTGEAAPDTLVVTEHSDITIEAEATHIPEQIEVSIEGLEVGTQILAGDLSLPRGSTLQMDPESLVVNVTHQATAEEVESELAEAEAEAGVEHEEPEATAETAQPESGGGGSAEE